MLVLLFFSVAAVIKNGWRWLLVLVPVVGNTLGLLVITTSDQPRYYYATLIIAPFIAGAAFIKDKRLKGKINSTEEQTI
jgi:hypothetical protein